MSSKRISFGLKGNPLWAQTGPPLSSKGISFGLKGSPLFAYFRGLSLLKGSQISKVGPKRIPFGLKRNPLALNSKRISFELRGDLLWTQRGFPLGSNGASFELKGNLLWVQRESARGREGEFMKNSSPLDARARTTEIPYFRGLSKFKFQKSESKGDSLCAQRGSPLDSKGISF